jgi:hypothetical protein
MVNRVKKIGRYIGAIKSGYGELMGKNLSRAVNARAVDAVSASPASFKKGGKVKKTGKALVHKGEVVLNKKVVAALKKLMN